MALRLLVLSCGILTPLCCPLLGFGECITKELAPAATQDMPQLVRLDIAMGSGNAPPGLLAICCQVPFFFTLVEAILAVRPLTTAGEVPKSQALVAPRQRGCPPGPAYHHPCSKSTGLQKLVGHLASLSSQRWRVFDCGWSWSRRS